MDAFPASDVLKIRAGRRNRGCAAVACPTSEAPGRRAGGRKNDARSLGPSYSLPASSTATMAATNAPIRPKKAAKNPAAVRSL